MKTILYLLSIFIVFSSMLEPIAAKPEQHPGAVPVTINNHPRPHTHRSAVPIIAAYYDSDFSALEIGFNDCMGRVVIYIQDHMGQNIAKYECNTDMESMAFIPCDLEETETYTIKFVGKDLDAEGYIYPGGGL